MPRWPIAGMGSGSWIDVSDGTVEVRSILGFRCRFDVAEVSEAYLHDGDVGRHGIHGRKGRWLINGAPSPVVVVVLRRPVRGRSLLGLWPATIEQVSVSVRTPLDLIHALK